MDLLLQWLTDNPQFCGWFTTLVRFLFPILALMILIRTIHSLLTVPCLPEVWAYLTTQRRPGAADPLGEHPGPGRQLRRNFELPGCVPAARGPDPPGGRHLDGL